MIRTFVLEGGGICLRASVELGADRLTISTGSRALDGMTVYAVCPGAMPEGVFSGGLASLNCAAMPSALLVTRPQTPRALFARGGKCDFEAAMLQVRLHLSTRASSAAAASERPSRSPRPTASEPADDPFPGMYPGAKWKRVYTEKPPGGRYYLSGRLVRESGATVDITAFPAPYAPLPVRRKCGLPRFLRGTDGGGFWLRDETHAPKASGKQARPYR